ncbi:hypothetical protein LTR91_009932 [Friedmanniomyces endolithicus]|uniref:AD domain-containing protein n=1 Tax=Friedmanniomyces endolithicus TaxID=329885 RepID=A0AAN6KKM6_9PEZI|nr:hypothetical protein LTR94_008103 [Friedmanniomyces endolithicus]KAK0772715.1 hypothetical protein LTR75_017335 [Friedmanniomyces endolithicus]KAK0778809.1 hypothetical protein LTR38_014663 [Friedmanniomyces endolithicus]KAK0804912.1 hypothetical protein LTR59_004250 [Friedmanniomyces endolithicus]KAK0853555.1 hypothetical protein LTR03_002819 [Friedmanniomyces endolithicus]
MADSKRNDAAGKVAMPKTGGGAPAASPLPDIHEAIAKAIGAHIKVTTTAPDSNTYEGSLYTADPISNLLVLNIRAAATKTAAELASQPGDYRVMPISRLQSFQIVSLASGSANPTTALPKLSEVDMKRLEKRCEDRVAVLKEEERSRGKGVTREGQAIFDALKRINLPVHWHNREMIVFDSIIVTPPYRAEDCKCANEKQEVLIRVKKALEGERKKLQEKERKMPVPGGPRKGG